MKDNIYLVKLKNGSKQLMFLVFLNQNKIILGFRTVKYQPYILNTVLVNKNMNLHYDIGVLYEKIYSIPSKAVGKMIGVVDSKTRDKIFNEYKKKYQRKQIYKYKDIPLNNEIFKEIKSINEKIILCKINNQDDTKFIERKAELLKELGYKYKEPMIRGNRFRKFDGYREAINKNGIWVYGTRFYNED